MQDWRREKESRAQANPACAPAGRGRGRAFASHLGRITAAAPSTLALSRRCCPSTPQMRICRSYRLSLLAALSPDMALPLQRRERRGAARIRGEACNPFTQRRHSGPLGTGALHAALNGVAIAALGAADQQRDRLNLHACAPGTVAADAPARTHCRGFNRCDHHAGGPCCASEVQAPDQSARGGTQRWSRGVWWLLDATQNVLSPARGGLQRSGARGGSCRAPDVCRARSRAHVIGDLQMPGITAAWWATGSCPAGPCRGSSCPPATRRTRRPHSGRHSTQTRCCPAPPCRPAGAGRGGAGRGVSLAGGAHSTGGWGSAARCSHPGGAHAAWSAALAGGRRAHPVGLTSAIPLAFRDVLMPDTSSTRWKRRTAS